MGLNPFTLALVLFAVGAGLTYLWMRRYAGLFTGRAARLPRALVVEPLPDHGVPPDARGPLDFLELRLGALGFQAAGGPHRAPDFTRGGRRLVVAPFVHEDESTFFYMGVEAGLTPRAELMLHIITPLTDDRRVETSTLPSLAAFRPPAQVDARVVLEADSVEEIWSVHRRALTEYERRERQPVAEQGWLACADQAYQAWLQAAVRAHRLVLDVDRDRYRVRSRPRGVV